MARIFPCLGWALVSADGKEKYFYLASETAGGNFDVIAISRKSISS
jgi:hypothetical protein